MERVCLGAVCAAIIVALCFSQPVTATNSCNYSFPGTAGTHQFTWCISLDGNLYHLESPFGEQHMTSAAEGYALCTPGVVHGYDVGFAESGFGPATVLAGCGWPIKTACVISRTTSDGQFQLVQKFTTSRTQREITIEHQVKNLGTTAVSDVVLSRSFNANMNSRYENYADTSGRSAWLRNVERLGLTALTLGVPAASYIEEYRSSWSPFGARTYTGCDPIPVGTPTTADDWVGRVNYDLGTLKAGAKKTVKYQYRID